MVHCGMGVSFFSPITNKLSGIDESFPQGETQDQIAVKVMIGKHASFWENSFFLYCNHFVFPQIHYESIAI